MLVVVSHDRGFLDRTVEEVLALDGAGAASMVRGGVEGWLRQRAAIAASSPASRRSTPSTASGTAPASAVRPARSGGRSPSTLRRLLGQAERTVDQTISARDRLLAELATVGGDHAALRRIGAALAEAEEAVADAEGRWLELAHEAEAAGLDP